MKQLKRAAAVLLAVCLIFSLAACGGVNIDKTAKKLHIEQAENIRVWYCDDRYTDYLNFVADRFHSANELVTIEPVLVDSDNYLENIYEESVRNGNVADVYLMLTDELEKASMMGLTVENSTYSDLYTQKNYGNSAIEAASYKGKLYGYPVTFDVPFLVYNKNAASSVETFSQLIDYCHNYTVNDDNQNVEQLVSWDVSDMLVNYGLVCGSVKIGGESGDDNTKLSADKDLLKKSLTEFVKLRDEFGIVRAETTLDSCADLFAQGKLAYTITDVSHINTIAESGISYGVCSIPALSDDMQIENISENLCAFVNPYSSDVQTAKAVANALSYDYAAAVNSTTGLLSSRTISINSKEYKDTYGKIYEIYSTADVKAKFMGAAYFYTKFDIMLHQVWDGTDIETSVNSFLSELKVQ